MRLGTIDEGIFNGTDVHKAWQPSQVRQKLRLGCPRCADMHAQLEDLRAERCGRGAVMHALADNLCISVSPKRHEVKLNKAGVGPAPANTAIAE